MRWLLLGDSHMEALGPRLERMLRAGGAEHVAFVARRGQGVAAFLEDARALVRTHRPDVVLVELGANDGRWTTAEGASAFRARVAQLVATVESEGAKALWVGPPQATDPDAAARRPKVVAELRSTLPSLGVPFLDARPMTANLTRTDGVHFTGASYDTFAAGVAGWASRNARSRGWLWALAGAAAAGLGLGAWALTRGR